MKVNLSSDDFVQETLRTQLLRVMPGNTEESGGKSYMVTIRIAEQVVYVKLMNDDPTIPRQFAHVMVVPTYEE
jgi:hypothetical protein